MVLTKLGGILPWGSFPRFLPRKRAYAVGAVLTIRLTCHQVPGTPMPRSLAGGMPNTLVSAIRGMRRAVCLLVAASVIQLDVPLGRHCRA